MDPRRTGKPYRYLYGNCVCGPRPCNSVTGTCRIDVLDGSVATWSEAPDALPAGPPTFLPRPGAAEGDETDGVVLLDYQARKGVEGGGGGAYFRARVQGGPWPVSRR